MVRKLAQRSAGRRQALREVQRSGVRSDWRQRIWHARRCQQILWTNWLALSGVSESESREDRDKTPHFGYRQLTGDTRKWGSPWNIFLEPASLAKTGDVLTEKAWVVNGELIEADVDKFIADHLKPSTATVITPCKECTINVRTVRCRSFMQVVSGTRASPSPAHFLSPS